MDIKAWNGTRNFDRPALDYIDVLKKDPGLVPISIRTAMYDCGVWKAIVDR